MMSRTLPILLRILCGTALALLAGCSLFSDDEEQLADRFFPLKVGKEWTYEITESDLDTTGILFPRQYTVSVLGDIVVQGKNYFLVHNYFTPGPFLPDTILVRNEGSRVYVRFGPDRPERVLYSFAAPDTVWSIPMLVNRDHETRLYHGVLEATPSRSVIVHWNSDPYPPGELRWQEVFDPEVGRSRIISWTPLYLSITWDLLQSNAASG